MLSLRIKDIPGNMERLAVFVAFLVLSTDVISASSGPATQANIYTALQIVLGESHPDIPPLTSGSGPVTVSTGLSLTAIREVDTEKNELEIVAMISQQWTNRQLAWGELLYGNNRTPSVTIDKSKVWVPDIVAYNAVTAPELLSPERVLVNENGTVVYVPLVRFRFKCYLGNVDTDDGSVCVLRLGPWTENADVVDVVAQDVILSSYDSEPEYELVEAASARYLVAFPCCEGYYSQARFSFNIRKRKSSLQNFFDW
ncbi:neuronal acetylcholine receptor subunit alpha-6 [Elysia marginata]|uniref:Neuronal acetylcholine receptor subunit alpha-6 n=1 Tax=Elysia marginata TaxID=1093978 RepID=A0AAV4H5Q3_9GAST|nr:neuronal acetylcholine receptor subunit alpha-6 [Elysia marginata]